MNQRPKKKTMEQILREDGRYPLAAVQFVRDGLEHAVTMYHGEGLAADEPRHVSGGQLCEALRDLASRRWGFLARSVLNRWRLRATRDFGEIVFLLVDHGYMQKQPEDAIEDFDDVFNFAEAFDGEYEIMLDG
jgi:uncharacterized repeat protein (TIGR04138 family)